MAKESDKPVEVVETIPTPQVVREKLSKWHKTLSPQQLDLMVQLHVLLAKFNKTINLISATTMRNAESVHFADSILGSQVIHQSLVKNADVFDIGSGNGFPGLVFAILYPTIAVTLVDRDTRKAEYLKTAKSELKLANVTVSTLSVEQLPEKALTNVVLRGFAPLSKAMLVLRKQVKLNGRCFHMKGDGFANELAQVPTQLFTFWAPSLIGQYKLPEGGAELTIIMTEKTAE